MGVTFPVASAAFASGMTGPLVESQCACATPANKAKDPIVTRTAVKADVLLFKFLMACPL
jgi:hypothetical protein